MVTREKFEFLKEKYGHWTSWAIWPEASDTPKSNVGDLSIFIGIEFLQHLRYVPDTWFTSGTDHMVYTFTNHIPLD
jgi:hypothetical protein